MAGTAALNITSFSVSTDAFSGNFAFADDAFSNQLYNLSAKEAGGALGEQSVNFSADNWNLGPNHLAQTANTKATGNTVNFTDPSTQLTTAGFNLAAQATAAHSPPAQPNSANASAVQSGAFMLIDGNGAPIGGLKVITEHAWFAARPSGTEDVYKVYAESFQGPEHLARVQEEAKAVVTAALGG